MEHGNLSVKSVIKSLGIVFGDIGTSPIYTLGAVFSLIDITLFNVLGILSLIVWTLVMLVTIQYAWLAMSMDDKGEGGTIVLKQQLVPMLTSQWAKALVAGLTFLGISFFIGDGVITPAISILSAVEGLNLIPNFGGFRQEYIILIAAIISIFLFAVQRRGTDKVSLAFGPIMLLWFAFLALSGLGFIFKNPAILHALNPSHGLLFLKAHGFIGFLVLSKVILCATGAEALYADMGHLGRRSIVSAWSIVFVVLICAYLGQGAFLLSVSSSTSLFYQMVAHIGHGFYIPVLVLSIMATIVASQAMISGIFSIVYQGMTTNIIPRLQVEYTSREFMSQIYIPLVNGFLLVCVLFAIVTFKYSSNLANAYGLAASGTMTITAILLTWIFLLKKSYFKAGFAFLALIVDCVFLASNTYKIPYGGYWSLVTASIPLSLILLYIFGQRKLYSSMKILPLDVFMEKYMAMAPNIPHINGTAIFLIRNLDRIPAYIAQTMFTNTILYEENIFVTMTTMRTPFGMTAVFKDDLAPGLRVFEIHMGYMEVLNIERIFNQANIHPKVIFYGVEEITTRNFFWKIYTVIKRLTPSFVQFYRLPLQKLHGVIVRVEM